MKVIIAGSRDIILSLYQIEQIVAESKFDATEIVSGQACGVDTCGEAYAKVKKIPVKSFPADWNNIKSKGAIIKTNKFGVRYNAKAGFDRNEKMAEYADALILVWDGQSHGSKDMLNRAKEHSLKIFTKVL